MTTDNINWQEEGQVRFQVGPAFFRPQARLARDLGVLAAAVYKHRVGQLRVLDGMAGCGVRALRYTLNSQADFVWANDSDPELHNIIAQNLSRCLSNDLYRITHWDANRACFDCYTRQDFYDLIDLDCFGSPGPYLSSCLWSVTIGGLLYITSTDGRGLTGHAPESALATYGAYPRVHPSAHEQGLRVLLGRMHQLAAVKGLGIQPVFSFYARNTYRVMLRLVHQPAQARCYGFLGYCHTCGNYQSVAWSKLGRSHCRVCQATLVLSGPLWLGNLHDRSFVTAMMQFAATWHYVDAMDLLQVMAMEAEMPPYFFTLGEVGRRGKTDIPQRSYLIQQLQEQGYVACCTHLSPQAIKTTADLQACIAIAQSVCSDL